MIFRKCLIKAGTREIIFELKQDAIFDKQLIVLSDFLKTGHGNGQVLMQESLRDPFWVLIDL